MLGSLHPPLTYEIFFFFFFFMKKIGRRPLRQQVRTSFTTGFTNPFNTELLLVPRPEKISKTLSQVIRATDSFTNALMVFSFLPQNVHIISKNAISCLFLKNVSPSKRALYVLFHFLQTLIYETI